MGKVRVLVAEDSLTVRKRLVEVLSGAPDLEVVGEAADGKRAIELCVALRPDVITLDMMMPHMTGLAATEYIMAYCPTPILIVSASTNRGELFKTFDALAAGAVDVLEKPLGDEPADEWERRLVSTVKLVSRIKVITHVRAKISDWRQVPAVGGPGATAVAIGQPAPAAVARAAPTLLAIGASTGGPSAILDLLRGLRRDFPLPILVVIHIGQPFGAAFADWLDGQSPIRVASAVDREPLPGPGEARVILATPDLHLEIQRGRLRLTDGPERHSCRPSVDVLFESVARELGPRAIACLLTGMGRDGAKGLLAIRQAGGRTLAQDESSSVVFGMPREAIALGAAERVLPLDRIAEAVRAVAAGGDWPA